MQGTLSKMRTRLDDDQLAQYQLPLGEQLLDLNRLIGQTLTLTYTGHIICCNCGKKTKKSYSEGHCYVCMSKLASCDLCIMKPETCHFAKGTCREPEWGQANCFIDHYVYLSNTSGLKVGITRHTQVPTRWIDQGATQALPIFRVRSRLISGLIEKELSNFVADKTHWQAMLKGNNENLDLKARSKELIPLIRNKLSEILCEEGDDAIQQLDESVTHIKFPVVHFPAKVKSFNFDKDNTVSGILEGIKGQYLMFDTGVINIRKFSSYEVIATY